jgi:hypothetical protein
MRDINSLILKIEALEKEIEEAKNGKRSEAYLINLGQQLTELRREKNILLEKEKRSLFYFLFFTIFVQNNFFIYFWSSCS